MTQPQGANVGRLNLITAQLATGGDLPTDRTEAVRTLREWRALGMTHVVDTRHEWSDEVFVAEHCPEIRYLHHGVVDAGQQMADEWFRVGTEWVRSALRDPSARVLVHCQMGINRGPSMAYACLLMLGCDPVSAMTMVRLARPVAAIGYAEQALSWHHRTYGMSRERQSDERERLGAWREANWVDGITRERRGNRETPRAW